MNGCSYTIKGKEEKLYFGIPALAKMTERQQKFPSKGMLATPSFICNMLYGGYFCNCEIEDLNLELTYKDFYMHIENELANGGYSEQTSNALSVYQNSVIVKGVEKPQAEIEEKKKLDESFWYEVEEFAYGELALKPNEFNRLTWAQYQKMKQGWSRRHSRQLEIIRPVIYTIAATNRDPKKSFPSIQEFMPLITDVAIDEDSEADRLQKLIDENRAQMRKKKVVKEK